MVRVHSSPPDNGPLVKWLNTYAFHAYIHGFKSRTGHQRDRKTNINWFFLLHIWYNLHKEVVKMIYFDYSATTKPDEDVIKRFNELANKFYANPNSHYDLAIKSNDQIIAATSIIANFFGVNLNEIIYTSGASESNNLAIKGIVENYPNKQIISTKLEHSSIITPLGYLQKKGYKVSFVDLNEDGTIKIDHLKELLKEDTILVSIGYVSSELGIVQPIDEIGELLKKYPHTYFHSDITQAVGKINIDLTNVDLASFSGHKFYCLKGIGGLIKKNSIPLIPLIHGGRSVTNYRSGTPQTELIGSMGFAINKIEKLDELKLNVTKLNQTIVNHLSKYPNIKTNSTDKSIPHILNLSILNHNSDDIQKYFADHEIYLSTKTACSNDGTYSTAIYELYSSIERAESSIRISLSKYSSLNEVTKFLEVLDQFMELKS